MELSMIYFWLGDCSKTRPPYFRFKLLRPPLYIIGIVNYYNMMMYLRIVLIMTYHACMVVASGSGDNQRSRGDAAPFCACVQLIVNFWAGSRIE